MKIRKWTFLQLKICQRFQGDIHSEFQLPKQLMGYSKTSVTREYPTGMLIIRFLDTGTYGDRIKTGSTQEHGAESIQDYEII